MLTSLSIVQHDVKQARRVIDLVLDWQSAELNRIGQVRWETLCNSFDEVLAVLRMALPQSRAIKELTRQAERAQRGSR
jgi:hypothetical protein